MEHIDRRTFLNGAGRFAAGALAAGTIFEAMSAAGAQQVAKATHAASARVVDRLRTRFMFQISVDVATIQQGLAVAAAALAGGVNIVEMGTPLLKNEGVSNVVPAFRRKFPDALLLADMKTMDGGAFEARGGLCRRRQHRRFPRARRGGYGEGDLRRARRVQARRRRTAAARFRRHHGAAPGTGRAGRRGRPSHARGRCGRRRRSPAGGRAARRRRN